jgi:L-lactate dehydrogenase (cytochrome)
MIAASVDDYRELARRRLPHFLFEYVDGGSFAEQTLARNVADLRALTLRQRVLRDVSRLEPGIELFGRPARLPLALAPIGLAGLCARRGEVQAARAAQAFGVPFTLSTVGCCSLAEVARGVREPFWFQLYVMRDRGFMKALLDEAEAAGCAALVFTVDMAVPGARYRDVRSGLASAPGLGGALRRFWQAARRPNWAWQVGVRGRPHELGNVAPLLGGKTGVEDFFAWMRDNFDASVSWRDLEWVRERWRGPLVVKGVLDAPDAVAAVELGANGVVVSNHGGRQLDGVLSTARALPRIADAVGGRALVLADGGIRSGLDVLRMLALGANAVLLGRAWIYALAARGEAGVSHVLELIERELRVAMALTGVTRIADIDRTLLDEAS